MPSETEIIMPKEKRELQKQHLTKQKEELMDKVVF